MAKGKIILMLVCSIVFTTFANAQSFTFSLTGNPINTTGWTTSAQSYVNGNTFVLTHPTGGQAGYIYYSTPEDLANCSQFTVTFDFRITNGSNPIADGISFWYITNPPTGFTAGGGLGLPTYPNGLVLLLDTYNNDGYPNNNPLISLRRYDGSSLQYDEGTSTGRIVPDVDYQSFITDGNWHTCKLTYSFGTITVSFDNNPPIMTGTTNLNITGYFGFSASTGALWSEQAIKNVTITGAHEPSPPVSDTTFYCRGDSTLPLTATPSTNDAQLAWYTSATGGQPLPGAPTPSSDVPGTYVWYVSNIISNCQLESTRVPVVVVVKPLPEFDRYDTLCPGGSLWFYGRRLTLTGTYDTIIPAPPGQCDSYIVQHIFLQPNPHVGILPHEQLSFCAGDSGILKVDQPSAGADYKWYRNNEALASGTGNDITVNQAGAYQVVGNLKGCLDTSQKAMVVVNPLPIAQILNITPPDACAFDTVTIEAQPAADEARYRWAPSKVFRYLAGGEEGPTAHGVFTKPVTKVMLMVYNKYSCWASDSIMVKTRVCCQVFIPNAFSPNGDGLNDIFRPRLQAGQKLLTFTIFDRYGQVVFNQPSGDSKKGWDGRFPNGQPAASGTYMYLIRYTCSNGQVYKRRSDVTLIR